MKRGRWIAITVLVLAASSVGALTAWLTLRASLPKLDGSEAVPGLLSRVSIERDAAGVPTLTASTREDLARGLGFVHAQDRFFQMDLQRRAAAGELSALLGPSLLPTDRRLRLHRFRHVAHEVVSQLDARERALLDAYVAGVNAGLDALSSRPFEYWLLRATPKPWTAEDSILCIHTMYLQLQDGDGQMQLQRALLRASLPEAAWRFLEAGAPEWDAAVDSTREQEPRIPLASEFDRRQPSDLPVAPPAQLLEQLHLLGSNNWAVSGKRTANGAALVANDMHLGYRVPIIWYRARMIKEDRPETLDLTGITLPGAPSMVAGSNGAIAWGFTNSYGKFATVVRLVAVPTDDAAYLTAAGPKKFLYVDEALEVQRGATQHLKIALTEWGPVIGNDWQGRPYALQWSPQDPSASNLKLLKLEQAKSVDEALRLAPTFGIPGQNFIAADKMGNIGWTIAGRLPLRRPAESAVAQLSTDLEVGFSGWLDATAQPRVINPQTGFLWSANARVVGGTAAILIGDDGMDRGARAAQIREDLLHIAHPFTPADSLAVQLDDRSLFLERWKMLMVELVAAATAEGRDKTAVRDTLAGWSGHAMPADAAYRLVTAFRQQVEARVYFMLIAPARAAAADFHFSIPSSFEGPLWRLVQERPLHLLAASYPSWNALLQEALTASERLPPDCSALPTCTWGRVNTVHIAHPLSNALPFLAQFLDMPAVIVAGGREDMPRIQGRDYGASERFSVAPGHETDGYFHMPGAQSGHPLSAFYRVGFSDWASATPSPFLPGQTTHTLLLIP